MKERQDMCSRPGRFRRRRFAAALSLFALAAPGTLSAQPWGGDSTLGVLIRGAAGPVAGAVVEIRYRQPGLDIGPEARRTDGRGQANFVGITDGRWSLEIKHSEYLSFVASINIDRGKKPEILTQFLEATGPGRSTFRVKFFLSDQVIGEVVPGTAASEPPPQPKAPLQPPAEAAATDRPVSTPAPKPAPGIDRPAPETAEPSGQMKPRVVPITVTEPLSPPPPVPAAKPPGEAPATTDIEEQSPTLTGEVPTPLASPAEEAVPVPEVDPAPTAEPAVAAASAPAAAAPAPEPTMQPSPGAPSEPAPAEVSPPVPAPQPRSVPLAKTEASIRAYRNRTCLECKPGEWAVSTELEVAGGDACRATADVAVRRALSDVIAFASEQLGSFAGPLVLDLEGFPLAKVSVAARNTLAPYLEPSASCRFLAVVVPQGGRFTGFQLEARDADATGTCTGGEECEIGRAKFVFSAAIARGTGASIVYSLFENTGESSRSARLTGFFLPASGWAPDSDDR